MREIKFRVYDSTNDIMVFQSASRRDDFWYPFGFEVRGELMQYTGLKDKNGTEIYEGDILQRNDNSITVVEFENGMFVTKYDALMWELYENSPIVIGNIYQNPDLLR